MSIQVLFNLLNKMEKGNKMWGLPSIPSLFYSKLKFNNTGAQMFDSIYHMTLKLQKMYFFAWKCQYFAIFSATL